ncbi:response regulator transcription factor [Oscillatoria salina]|uniref:response regulator transcription factor n=1 Tax=Oscillatoria salina TaxID=331517 RepID=UPI0013BAA216|nr:response regulator transcription factor [Oscillatoria salina]MBZ8180904.1 response regulator transcription factor [Oscillatoria salina IIICB1]NET91327.1 response regulator transcription factor [Kamptonema sp. SIO1D9]
MKILIVEDEPEIAKLIQQTLEREGFTCFQCHNGLTALQAFKEQEPDVIILDLMLPGLDGLEVCARIRQQPGKKDPFILMLTAKGEEIDRVIGLSTGADDYLVKPFSPKELVARVRALLRRSLRQIQPQELIYTTEHFEVNIDQRTATKKMPSGEEETLNLSNLEFNLFSTFVKQPGRVWNRSQLIEQLWGDDFFGDERVVDTHIGRLRKKVEPDPANPTFIKTVIGVGYKFED